MADGKIVIDVILDDGTVAKGVADLNSKIGGLGSAGEKASLGIGKIASALGLVALAKKGIDLVKNSLQDAFKRIDTFEQFERVMTAVTGSTKETKKALDRTNEAVKGTAYTLDGAASAVQNFVTRGATVDKATKYVEAWGDAVAFYGDGSQEQFNNVTDALAKMQTKGTVGMDQLNRLFDAGIDAVGMYAQATGQNASDVQDALSKGEISAEDFIDTVTTAMMEGTNGVIKIKGAAKEAGATWGSTFSNMRTAVARGTANIISSIDEMLENNGLPNMRDMVAKFGEHFENVLNEIAEKIPGIVEKFISIYNALEPWLPLIGAIVAGIIGFIATMETIAMVKAIITGVEGAFALLNATILANPIALVVAAIVAAAALIYFYWDPIKDFFATLWDFIKETGLAIWESLKEAWSSAVDIIKSTWEVIKDFFSSLWGSVTNIISTAYDFITNITSATFSAYVNIIKAQLNLALSIVKSIWDFIKNTFKNALSFIKSLVTGDFEGMKKAVSNQMENTKKLISNILNAIRDFISNVLNNIKNKFSNIFNSLRGIVSNAFSGVQNAVSTGINGALRVVTNIASSFYNAGRNLVTSIANGIRSAIGQVTSAISSVTSKIRNFLPFSPAKTGPLRDLDKLNFKDPIKKSIKSAIPDVHGQLNAMLSVPGIGAINGANMGVNQATKHDNETLITGNTFIVRKESDIERIAQELENLRRRKERGGG